ncbi:MAG: amino acid adenylation domain-containing protein, partial [Cyanobacteria bacterium J06635_10]
MKSIEEFLLDISSLDIKLKIDGSRLYCNAPQGLLTPELSVQLRERKTEILEFLHNNTNFVSNSTYSPIVPVPRDTNLPLSFAQQRLWFLNQLEPNSTAYNFPISLRISGALNVAALEQSINKIVQRHETLRTTFTSVNGHPVQVINPTFTLKLSIVDLQEYPKKQQDAEVLRLAIQETQLRFNLAQGPLLRATILHLCEQEYVLLFTMHHIVSDGWSIGLLVKEVTAHYKAFCKGKPSPLADLPIQYADFAVWQRQWLQGEVLKSQISYWRKQLADAPRVLDLPTDYPRAAIRKFQGATYSFELSEKLSVALNTLSQQQKSSLFMTLLASFQILLWRYTGSEDIVVGSPIANRNRDEIKELIGFFLNTLVLRTNLAGNPSFEELLFRVREMTLGAYAHEDLPFEFLVDELQPQRSLSYTPLFQVGFVLQNAPVSTFELPGLTLNSLSIPNTNADFDLNLDITERINQIYCNLHYNANLFEASTIERMAGHFQTLLEAIVTNPQQRLSELPLLTESEQDQLLREWNNTEAEYPLLCVHELFEAQVEKTPLSVAVVFEDQQLTYRELNIKANQLAHHLRSLGVKPEVLVGICVERSLDMVIGLLAILKAGGAYVPLDPSYPQERIAFILEETQAPVLLTQASPMETIPQHQGQVVCLDTDWHFIAQQSQDNLFSELTPENLAYIIYTSGSTGKPKGVQIPHIALSNFLHSMKQAPGLTNEDILLAVTTYSFDIAALELFLPIIVGARVVIANREIVSDGMQLSAKLMDSKATVMQATPATWQLLLAAGWNGNRQLKILCGGEALPAPTASKLLERCDSLWNMYGPTETTIWSAASQVKTDSRLVTISQPIANTQLYILDKYNQLVPVGVVGELHIGGNGLSRGYFLRADITAEKFISHPYAKNIGERLYKTGDLARYLPNGEIEYIGRVDYQVKLRGFRIELGEIEAVINQFPGVRESVVVLREDRINSQTLVAYLVPQVHQMVVFRELQEFLGLKLPNYMIPGAFVTLESLPLTPNGKIDRKALPKPDLTLKSSANNLPSTPIENLLAGIWTEVLGIDGIGVDQNFFDLGGHSLIATRVISQIRQVFQVELALRCLFEKPTIAQLAEEIEKAIQVGLGTEKLDIERIERSPGLSSSLQLPLSFAQQRLWFLDQLEPNNPNYNIFHGVRIQGLLNMAALKQSFEAIVQRHEALRTSFQTVDSQPIQIIVPNLDFSIPIIDLSEYSQEQQEQEIHRLAKQEVQKPFDLSQCPLLRVTALKLDIQEHIILLSMHHIVSDAWSMGILVEELTTLYPSFCTGKPLPLAELPIQYGDFAVWQRQWLQKDVLQTHLDYWQQQLGNIHPRLALPKSSKHSSLESNQGARELFSFSKDISEALDGLSRQQGVTLFMTLLAAFQVLLHCFTGTPDIRVGSPIANRNRVEIESLIGFFVNTLVLRIDLSGNPSFSELLMRSRRVTMDAYAHQDIPFEKLVEELQPERNLNHNPLYQAWFVLQNIPMPQLELPGLNISSFEIETNIVRHDLLLEIDQNSQGLNGRFEYKTDLFDKNSISRLIEHFEKIIRCVIAEPEIKVNELAKILNQSDRERQELQK